ncbi:hypothetical protein H5976_08775, partial [Streptococcus alactolyticus]|uniref:hypothetical protein n=1 Tax=Streptococcus alactolyticus TaxID=29389 RepID=UPI0019598914
IGYCQEGYFGGIRFSTVHIPCKNCGSGFGLTDDQGIIEPTINDAKQAFINYPQWVNIYDRASVKKYIDWNHYISQP